MCTFNYMYMLGLSVLRRPDMSLLEEIQRHERKMEDREYCILLLRLRVCVTVMIVLTITLSLKWKLCFFFVFFG